MIVVDVRIGGCKVGKICKPDSSRKWRWSAYVKGKMSFRDHYAWLGNFSKRDAIRAVKEWSVG